MEFQIRMTISSQEQTHVALLGLTLDSRWERWTGFRVFGSSGDWAEPGLFMVSEFLFYNEQDEQG